MLIGCALSTQFLGGAFIANVPVSTGCIQIFIESMQSLTEPIIIPLRQIVSFRTWCDGFSSAPRRS